MLAIDNPLIEINEKRTFLVILQMDPHVKFEIIRMQDSEIISQRVIQAGANILNVVQPNSYCVLNMKLVNEKLIVTYTAP